MWSVLVPDIRVRALRLMLIRICLVMKTMLAAKQADEILRGALGANPVPTASKRH